MGKQSENCRRAAAAAAAAAVREREAVEAQEANGANKAALGVPPNANRNPGVPPEANANHDPGVAANEVDPKELDPHDQDPPCKVWMGFQACGVHDKDAAKSLAKNSFMSKFSGCLKVTKEDIKDAFESLEKRSENDITIEPFIEEKTLAFDRWVKTCFWLNVDPEQVPFPKQNANAILDQSELHDQFLADASDDKTAMKPKLFTKDCKWDKWAKEFEECLTLLPGST